MALDESLLFWLWLTNIKGIGNKTIRNLLEYFRDPVEIYKASFVELLQVTEVSRSKHELIANSKSLEESKRILDTCKRLNIGILTVEDENYPKEIKSIQELPVLLFYRGTIIKESIGVSIVGSRRCTDYGKKVTKDCAEFLAVNNVPVISAYPPGTKPQSYYFAERNRLISAWCKKLLVVEAGKESGALITADLARKYHREIFAVPNSIFTAESMGTNRLIADGATILLDAKQLLLHSPSIHTSDNRRSKKEESKPVLTTLESKIMNLLRKQAMTIDELLTVIDDNKHSIIEGISIMELEGKLLLVGNRYRAVV